MASYFVESSALAKRYVTERGSLWVQSILEPATGCTVYIARVTTVEIVAATVRRARGGSITIADATVAISSFRRDVAAEYILVEVTPNIANHAMLLAETYALRGYDAIQLATCLEANSRYLSGGLPPVVLISSDKEINVAARTEGLSVEDPNAHP